MTTGLTLFEGQGAALPAHIAAFYEEEGSNIAPRTTVPSLSPEGKVWTIGLNGEKTKLQRRNTDGDLEPLPIFKAIVLNYNKNKGRSYYEGEYDPNKVSAPVCWSADGVVPDDSLPGPFAAGTQVEPGSSRKISSACATCPMAVKGSKVIPGTNKAVTACSQHRMLALIPDPLLGLKDIPPLRLKIAATSDWDKLSPDQEQTGWFAWSNYVDYLTSRGCKHTGSIVTKMKFDPDAAYPKILFAAERLLEPAELIMVRDISKNPDVAKLLGSDFTPAGADGVPKEQQKVAEPTADANAAQTPAAVVAAAEPRYEMCAGEPFTREQYHASGWSDAALLQAGKMVAHPVAAPAPAPAPPPAAAPAPPPAAVVEVAAVVVAEATPIAPVVSESLIAQEAARVTESALVIAETSAPSQPAAPPPVQEPAQPAPPPAAAAPAPEPAAAAAIAATVVPDATADVPDDVAALLDQWG